MRYITKEIYELMQQTSFHLLLRVNKKAETFNEEFYRKLYAKKLNERLMSDKEDSELKFEDIWDESDFEDKEAYELRREKYKAPEFNENESKRSFAEIHRMNIKRLQDALPDDILKRIADIRVLAFDISSASVKRSISEFCKENDCKVKSAFMKLRKAEEREFGRDEKDRPEFFRECLHDCDVLSCRMKGKDLVLELDNSGGFTEATGVIFKNVEIIEREERLAGAAWLNSEVYKCKRGLEIHALLWGAAGLKYLTLRCEDTVFVYDKDYEESAENGVS